MKSKQKINLSRNGLPWEHHSEIPGNLEEHYELLRDGTGGVIVVTAILLTKKQIEVINEICRVDPYPICLRDFIKDAIEAYLEAVTDNYTETGLNFCKYLKKKLDGEE